MGTLAALIVMVAPVRGLRPERAARLPTAKVPKPTSDTVPPLRSVVLTAPMVASSARVAAALEMSALLAMCSISSVLLTKLSLSQEDSRIRKATLVSVGNLACPRGLLDAPQTAWRSVRTRRERPATSTNPCRRAMHSRRNCLL